MLELELELELEQCNVGEFGSQLCVAKTWGGFGEGNILVETLSIYRQAR